MIGGIIHRSPLSLSQIANASNNLIIDGQMNHWDEGTSFTATGYMATMIFSSVTSITTPVIERSEFTLGQTDVPHTPRYYMDTSMASADATTGIFGIQSRCKKMRETGGKTVTFSVWLKGASAGTIGLRIHQNFGSGGSPSTSINYATEVDITTSWAEYSFTVELDSLSGKTFGSNNNDKLIAVVDQFLGSGSSIGYDTNPVYTDDLSVANLALVEGSTAFAGPFDNPQEERRKINSYYIYFNDTWYTHPISDGSSSRHAMVTYPAMESVPSVTLGASTGYTSGPSALNIGLTKFRIGGTATTASTQASVADITLDARL